MLADLFSSGAFSVSIAVTPLLMFMMLSMSTIPIKFNVLLPKSIAPNVVWLIVTFTAFSNCVLFNDSMGLIYCFDTGVAVTVRFQVLDAERLPSAAVAVTL